MTPESGPFATGFPLARGGSQLNTPTRSTAGLRDRLGADAPDKARDEAGDDRQDQDDARQHPARRPELPRGRRPFRTAAIDGRALDQGAGAGGRSRARYPRTGRGRFVMPAAPAAVPEPVLRAVAVKYTPVHPRRKRITLLEPDEVAAGANRVRLRSENANRGVALIYVLFCTGAKPIEIARLEVRDYLNSDGSIRERSEMRAETAVNGRSRPLFFTSSRACAAVDAYLVERRRRKLGVAGSPAVGCDAYRGLDPASALFLTEGGYPFEIGGRGPNDQRETCRLMIATLRSIFKRAG